MTTLFLSGSHPTYLIKPDRWTDSARSTFHTLFPGPLFRFLPRPSSHLCAVAALRVQICKADREVEVPWKKIEVRAPRAGLPCMIVMMMPC